MIDPGPEEDDRFAPREFGDRFSRFESEPARSSHNKGGPPETPDSPWPQDRSEISSRAEEREAAPALERNEAAGRDAFRESSRGFWSSLFSFEGRATRGQYWTVYLLGMAIMVMPYAAALGPQLISNPEAGWKGDIAVEDAEGTAQIESMIYVLWTPLALAFVWTYFAVTVRRYHDRDKSGVWLVLVFVPVASIAVLLECGFLPGTNGPNQYGADPRDR